MALVIAGLPLNVYTETISEPPTGRFQPPGVTLHLPGVSCGLRLPLRSRVLTDSFPVATVPALADPGR